MSNIEKAIEILESIVPKEDQKWNKEYRAKIHHDLKEVITLLSNLSPTVTFWEANYHKSKIKIQEFQSLSAIPKKDEDILFMDKYWKILRIIHELENNHIDIYLEEE
ncbi:MAG: hypothetical protein KME28_00445 [Pelatocladus maniniholoensis HA4357-MV3]|jgi:hypothetical protein|uniref:Uncharacterized protein n=1 Tax=Pelatocladus maniniholoensis HA4357-MV3 TaxID=1117104 RepID=A0A9E3H570_9NOST|nr:hypothetical protein [Pelatocladus maniniholoensis HA4357-MV3]BAZ68052.1 hypothetical protein NIES4106_28100 [Fischerella sp. NIES-4106]